MVLSTKGSDPAPPKCWTRTRNSGSLPWCAAIHRRVAHAGRYVWWPRKPSSGSWCRAWEGKPSGFCCSTTTSSRGGKKMWVVADLDEDYIAKMEDVLETYERSYDPDQPVVCLDEKPVTLHADVR